jgi:hypothetical protein
MRTMGQVSICNSRQAIDNFPARRLQARACTTGPPGHFGAATYVLGQIRDQRAAVSVFALSRARGGRALGRP